MMGNDKLVTIDSFHNRMASKEKILIGFFLAAGCCGAVCEMAKIHAVTHAFLDLGVPADIISFAKYHAKNFFQGALLTSLLTLCCTDKLKNSVAKVASKKQKLIDFSKAKESLSKTSQDTMNISIATSYLWESFSTFTNRPKGTMDWADFACEAAGSIMAAGVYFYALHKGDKNARDVHAKTAKVQPFCLNSKPDLS